MSTSTPQLPTCLRAALGWADTSFVFSQSLTAATVLVVVVVDIFLNGDGGGCSSSHSSSGTPLQVPVCFIDCVCSMAFHPAVQLQYVLRGQHGQYSKAGEHRSDQIIAWNSAVASVVGVACQFVQLS